MTDAGPPPGADDPRPWDQPGAVRRDVEPHRGHWFRLLRWCNLVALSLLAGSILLCLVGDRVGGLVGAALAWAVPLLTGMFALAVGLPTLVLATHDLARMRAGAMDRAGEADTRHARDLGATAALVGLAWVALWAPLPLRAWQVSQQTAPRAKPAPTSPAWPPTPAGWPSPAPRRSHPSRGRSWSMVAGA
jgi:hypothetical protein